MDMTNDSRTARARREKTDKLREKVRGIEARIRTIIDKTPWWDDVRHLRDRVDTLLDQRAACLDSMFLATPAEIARFEAINEMLLKKAEQMRARAAMLRDAALKMRQMPEFDDAYEIEGELIVEGDRSDEESVLRLPEDEYYGSDFALANEAIIATLPRNWKHDWCGGVFLPWQIEDAGKAPDDSFFNVMDNGQSWAEASLRHPSLSHICICHPIHDLVTHCNFSIPDLLRINSFATNVRLEISNATTQSGIRAFQKGYRSWNIEEE